MRKTLFASLCIALLSLTSKALADVGESGSYKAVRSAYRENKGLQNSSLANLVVGLSSSGAIKTASLKKNYSPSPNAGKFIAPQRASAETQSRLSNFWTDTVPVVIGPLGALITVAGFVTSLMYMHSAWLWLGLGLMATGLVLILVAGALAPL